MNLQPQAVGTVPVLANLCAEQVVKLFTIARFETGAGLVKTLDELREAIERAGDTLFLHNELPVPPHVWDASMTMIREWADASEAMQAGALLVAAMGAADVLQAGITGALEQPVAKAQPKKREQG